MKIVGVTKCPTGIAHTYMAAEKIEKACQKLGYSCKVETQGSQGTEHTLTAADIAEADYVLISADVAIDNKERFNGKMVTELPIKPVIKDAEGVVQALPQTSAKQTGSAITTADAPTDKISPMKALTNGASHMIPFVVVGGLFIALALSLGGTPTDTGMQVTSRFWLCVNDIGAAAFGLMYPNPLVARVDSDKHLFPFRLISS